MRQAPSLTRSGALYRDTRHGGENVELADSVTASHTLILKMDPSAVWAPLKIHSSLKYKAR